MKQVITVSGGLFLMIVLFCFPQMNFAQSSSGKIADEQTVRNTDVKSSLKDSMPDLADLVKRMTPADRSNAEEVKKQAQAQTEWMNYVLRLLSNPGKEQELRRANQAMVRELSGSAGIDSKVWLLHLLGWTGGDSEADAVAVFILNKNARLADESLRTLALIGSPKALKIMTAAFDKAEEPQKSQIKGMIRQTVHNMSVGVENILPMALPYVTQKKCAQWIDGFSKMNKDDQARTLGGLTIRGDRQYRPIALEALNSDNPDVVKAAVLALEKLGTVDDMIELRKFFNGPHRNTVILVLTRFVSEQLDSTLAETLKTTEDESEFLAFAVVSANRNIRAALPTILARIKKTNCEKRLDLLESALKIASSDDIPAFIETLLLISDRKDRDRAEQRIAELCDKDAAPVIALMNDNNAALLIGLIGRIGGSQAQKKLKEYLDNTAKPEYRGLAVRALTNWPNATVADTLWSLAQNANESQAVRVQCLRGFVRVITLPDEATGIALSNEDRLNRLQKAMDLAQRPEEKHLIIQRCGSVRDIKICKYVLTFITDPELGQDACRAIADLAHHDFLRKQNPEFFQKALTAVLEKTQDQSIKDRVIRYRDALKTSPSK